MPSDFFEETAYYNTESNWENGALYIGKHLIKVKDTTSTLNVKQGTLTVANEAARGTLVDSVTIPDSVIRIGEGAFNGCHLLKDIKLPKNDIQFGRWVFANCESLVSVVLPDNMKTIESCTFSHCSSLTDVIFPKSLTCIGDRAFEYCTALKKIKIPDSVANIEWGAFQDCSSLTSVEVPNSLKTIGGSTFSRCSSLETVKPLSSVNRIGSGAFRNCTALTDIGMLSSLEYIDDSAFEYCSSLANISFSDNLKYIGDKAFYSCDMLSNITLPDTIKSIGASAFSWTAYFDDDGNWELDNDGNRVALYIGNYLVSTYSSYYLKGNYNVRPNTKAIAARAFSQCYELTSISVPDSVIGIGHGAFLGCSSLTSFFIPKNVTEIQGGTFYGCTSLKNITIPNGVIKIEYEYGEKGAFEDCTSLTSITIPDSVTSIEVRAFKGCTSLTSVTISDGVTNIGDQAFANCVSLTEITVDKDNLNYSSADGVLFNKDQTELLQYPAGKTNKSYIIPDSVISLSSYCFDGCAILEEITFPYSILWIGNCFDGCLSLKKAVLPETVDYIATDVFGCDANGKRIENFDFTIYGAPGSYAETYAKRDGYAFVSSLTKIVDKASGVSISESAVGILNGNVQLKVINLDITDTAIKYDISLIKDGAPIQPNGNIVVKIPVPAPMHSDEYHVNVYRKEADGTYTNMYARYFSTGNGDLYMVFTTDHFSEYILTTGDPNVLVGDTDGNGVIDDWDSVLLDRYLAGWDVEINTSAADMDGNGIVDDWDGILLARKFAGWN